MIFAWKREKKGWRQASILREVSVGTIKMLMLVIIGLRKDGDKSLDGPLQPSSRRILVGFGFAPLCLIFKFQGMSRRWKLFHYKHSCHLFINIQFTWKGELSDSARSYGQHFQKDLLYARSIQEKIIPSIISHELARDWNEKRRRSWPW